MYIFIVTELSSEDNIIFPVKARAFVLSLMAVFALISKDYLIFISRTLSINKICYQFKPRINLPTSVTFLFL